MKYIILVSLVVCSVIILSCSDDNPTSTSSLKKYPTKNNSEWEYNTQMVINHYDDFGNIENTETMDLGNTVVKIVKVNDTLAAVNNLVKFESYELLTPEYVAENWYSNSDSGLFSIAYSNPGVSQPVIPKSNGKRYLTFEEFLSLAKSMTPEALNLSKVKSADSVIYYEVPRKVLDYPLTVNKRWVELVYPWYRERYVAKTEVKFFQGQALRCYVIKVDWPMFEIEFNDYINLDKGLIKREIISDSVFFSSVNNPDSGSYGKISTISDIVRISD